MRPAALRLISTVLFLPAALGAMAHDAAPEVQRPPGGTPQPVGQLHTLRNIPEACVRLEGQFTGDAAAPYRMAPTRHERCAQRALYVEAASLDTSPSVAAGWILNDRIGVTRADNPACTATIEVWRRPGDTAPPALDAQGRSRIYLDKHPPVHPPMFTAIVSAKGC